MYGLISKLHVHVYVYALLDISDFALSLLPWALEGSIGIEPCRTTSYNHTQGVPCPYGQLWLGEGHFDTLLSWHTLREEWKLEQVVRAVGNKGKTVIGERWAFHHLGNQYTIWDNIRLHPDTAKKKKKWTTFLCSNTDWLDLRSQKKKKKNSILTLEHRDFSVNCSCRLETMKCSLPDNFTWLETYLAHV